MPAWGNTKSGASHCQFDQTLEQRRRGVNSMCVRPFGELGQGQKLRMHLYPAPATGKPENHVPTPACLAVHNLGVN